MSKSEPMTFDVVAVYRKRCVVLMRGRRFRQMPETPARHALVLEDGALALKLSVDGGFHTIVFDAEDFDKAPAQLVDVAVKEWERVRVEQNAQIAVSMQIAAAANRPRTQPSCD